MPEEETALAEHHGPQSAPKLAIPVCSTFEKIVTRHEVASIEPAFNAVWSQPRFI